MVKVVLQPASGLEAREHYQNTIANFVDLDSSEISNLLTESERNELSRSYPDGRAWIWGARESMGKEWSKISKGDFVLFCQGPTYVSAHTVTYKTENLPLARLLWKSDWPYVYFVSTPYPANIPLVDINTAASPPYRIQGLQRMIVSDRGLEFYINDRLGSSWFNEASDIEADPSESSTDSQTTPTNWWVYQGSTYAEERDGGYVWAPQETKSGATLAVHSNVMLLKPGDRIVHYANGHVMAFGEVRSEPRLARRPSELPSELWGDEGYKADVQYSELNRQIALESVPVEMRIAHGGPFNRIGGPNQGYLYPITEELMEFLISIDRPSSSTSDPSVQLWDEFIKWAQRFFDWEEFDDQERTYKLEIAANVKHAQEEFSTVSSTWQDSLARAFASPNNLTPWRIHSRFLDLLNTDPALLVRALGEVWTKESFDGDQQVFRAVDQFISVLSEDSNNAGMMEVLGSFLSMAVSPFDYPIYRADPMNKAYKLVDHPRPDRKSTPSDRYRHGINFLDAMVTQSAIRGLILRDRLDAQSIIWLITKGSPPQHWDETTKQDFLRYRGELSEEEDGTILEKSARPYAPVALETIAESIRKSGLRIEDRVLRRYHASVWSKGFVILSGVSGTGKTWLAEEYADAVGGEKLLVPVAPNWTTNEDLLGYQNPLNDDYHHTSFSKFLKSASAEWKSCQDNGVDPRPYFLILDEMNLARIEFYFALFLSKLEVMHRGGRPTIELGAESVELTPNLKVIGTINVDETTQMFSDKVYDRSQLIELPVSRDEISSLIGDRPYREDLLRVWDAVSEIAPFAYRVIVEIEAYWKQATSVGNSSEEALDEQLLQKVLPKIRGMDPRIKSSLESISEITRDKYQLTFDKAQSMLDSFTQNGIASYFS